MPPNGVGKSGNLSEAARGSLLLKCRKGFHGCPAQNRKTAHRGFDIIWRMGGQKSHLEFHQVHANAAMIADFRDTCNCGSASLRRGPLKPNFSNLYKCWDYSSFQWQRRLSKIVLHIIAAHGVNFAVSRRAPAMSPGIKSGVVRSPLKR